MLYLSDLQLINTEHSIKAS